MMRIQNNVRKLRKERGFNQRQFAEKLHMCQSYLCAIETGRLFILEPQKRKIARALGVSVEDVFPEG